MVLSECLARDVTVKLSQTVANVEQAALENTSEQRVVVTTSDNNKHEADYVVCCVPLALLNRIQFEPALDPLKHQLSQRAPMGSIIKTVTFYKTAFWRESGLTGEMGSDRGIVAYCIDDTKPEGSEPAIMGFILSDEARQACSLSRTERQKLVTEQYARVFNDARFLTPAHFEEYNWIEDRHAGGCYTSNYGPGVMTSFAHVLRQTHKRVHFAGTESATEWAGE